jgi:A/B hydrolase-like, N-terminal domain
VTPDPAELIGRMVAAYGRGAWAEALEAAEAYAAQAPEEAEPVYWIACIRSRADDADGALATLLAGSERGFWWSPEMLRDDPDLETARGAPGFENVIAISERRMAEAREGVEPALLTEGEGDRVLLALHGRMGVVAEALEAWLPAVAAGFRVAALGSSQLLSSGVAGWDDLAVARSELDWAEVQLGTRPRVLGGFSQGGMLAIAEAVGGRADGFVALAPSVGRVGMPTLEELRPHLGRPDLRGAVVIGVDDLRLDAAREFAAAADEAGTPLRFDVVDGLDHAYPPDLGERLPGLLAFVAP